MNNKKINVFKLNFFLLHPQSFLGIHIKISYERHCGPKTHFFLPCGDFNIYFLAHQS